MKTIRVSITFDTEDGAFDNATVDAYTIHNALCRAFPLCRTSEIRVEDLPAPEPGATRLVVPGPPPASRCICPFGVLRGDCPEHASLATD
jgi:hypothetical protein